jgi:predicted kinase
VESREDVALVFQRELGAIASLVQSPVSVSADAGQDSHETRDAMKNMAGRRRCETAAISIDIRLWQCERVAQEFKVA